MIQISGSKKFLAFALLSLSFGVYASDSDKNTVGKGATVLKWACRGGAAFCLADAILGADGLSYGFQGEYLRSVKAFEFILGCGFAFFGWFHEDGSEGSLKDVQKKQLEKNVEQNEQEQECKQELNLKISSEDEQEEEKYLGEYQQEPNPSKKKRLRDKFKFWLSRHRSKQS